MVERHSALVLFGDSFLERWTASYDSIHLVNYVAQEQIVAVVDDAELRQLVDANYSFGSVRVAAFYSVIVAAAAVG